MKILAGGFAEHLACHCDESGREMKFLHQVGQAVVSEGRLSVREKHIVYFSTQTSAELEEPQVAVVLAVVLPFHYHCHFEIQRTLRDGEASLDRCFAVVVPSATADLDVHGTCGAGHPVADYCEQVRILSI